MNYEFPHILPRSFYSRHPVPVARDLLGKFLVREMNERMIMSGMITETEAYGPPSEDPLVKTEGARGLRMDWGPGLAWTSYMMRGKPTLNITTMTPSCVLIRAIEPKLGFEFTCPEHPTKPTGGPINLAKALRIDKTLDRSDITANGPIFLCEGESIALDSMFKSKRKNVRIDTEEARRFFIKGNRFVSS
jgi:DNA-3-methyladenine glycosylase